MRERKLHRILGMILILPMVVWAITGAIFFVKPGYDRAFEQLKIKTYPYDRKVNFLPRIQWRNIRLVKSVLGVHLLVEENSDLKHYDPASLQPIPVPSTQELIRIVEDAISHDIQRYGNVIDVQDMRFYTNTGVELILNWQNLSLSQQGEDTRLINAIYKAHYLQWTGHDSTDKVLGFFGLCLLLCLTFFGLTLIVSAKRNQEEC